MIQAADNTVKMRGQSGYFFLFLRMRNTLLFLFFLYISCLGIFSQPYCDPGLTAASGGYGITNVTLNTINYNSPVQQGYMDYYDSASTTLFKNASYVFSFTPGQIQEAVFWIDWNQDFVFDSGEIYYVPQTSGGVPISVSFMVPSTALTGSTRMRVASGSKADSDPCDITLYQYADIEDYKIVISESNMVFDSCTTTQRNFNSCILAPATNVYVIGIEIYTGFTLNPLPATSFTFNTFGTTSAADISRARIFYTGSSAVFAVANQFGVDLLNPSGAFTIAGNIPLQPGVNYFWLVYDIVGTPGNFIDASCTTLDVNAVSHVPTLQDPGPGFQVNSPVNYCVPKTTNTWLFGSNAGIDFNCSPPKPILRSRASFAEGTGCVSDNMGNLIFSTDGNTVYDKNYDVMPLGLINAAGVQPAQPVIVVPDPANANKYYLFTTPSPNGAGPLYYSVLDITLPGNGTVANPLGDIVAGQIKLSLLDSAIQSITAIRHCNRKDFWVITKRFNTNAFYVYPVTGAGIQAPVITNIGMIENYIGLGQAAVFPGHGQIKGSPDGKKIAYGHIAPGNTILQLYDFDNTTGIVSNYIPLTIPAPAYGVSFSPDNSKLYVALPRDSLFLLQFNVCAGSQAAIQSSLFFVSRNARIKEGIQLAPDGKIYCAHSSEDTMSVIQNPNLSGAACNFTPKSFQLMGGNYYRSNRFSVPNFIDDNFLDCGLKLSADKIGFTCDTVCVGSNTSFTDTSLALTSSCGSSLRKYSWDFGDASSGASNMSSQQNPSHQFSGSGIFTVKFIVEEGCQKDSVYQNILVDSLPVITVSGNNTVCLGNSSVLTVSASGSGSYSYNWTPHTGLSSSTGAIINFNPTQTTSYTVTGTSNNGCSNFAVMTFAVDSLPDVLASNGVNICAGDSASLSAGGANTYAWIPAAGLNAVTGSAVFAFPLNPGTYTVIGTDANGCSDTATVTVNVNQLPTIMLNGNNPICKGDTTVISASGAVSYTWSPALGLSSTTGTNPTIIITSHTTYTVTGTDVNGCSNNSVITVTVNLMPVANAGPDDTICEGQNSFLNATGGSSYLWNTGEGISSITVMPSLSTTYTVVVSNSPCFDSDSVRVVVHSVPTVDAGTNATIVSGASAALFGIGVGNYLWTPSSGLSCITCKNTIATPTETTTYYFAVTDSNGCSSIDSVLITVDLKCGEFFIPNAVSPNGDGQNDILFVKANCMEKMLFTIYNRWGEKVFETRDLNIGWDGYYNDQLMDTGVFAYKFLVTFSNSEEMTYKGNITLLR